MTVRQAVNNLVNEGIPSGSGEKGHLLPSQKLSSLSKD